MKKKQKEKRSKAPLIMQKQNHNPVPNLSHPAENKSKAKTEKNIKKNCKLEQSKPERRQ